MFSLASSTASLTAEYILIGIAIEVIPKINPTIAIAILWFLNIGIIAKSIARAPRGNDTILSRGINASTTPIIPNIKAALANPLFSFIRLFVYSL